MQRYHPQLVPPKVYAKLFRYVRKNKKLSQPSMAAKLGCSHSLPGLIETGSRTPNVELLKRLVERSSAGSLERLVFLASMSTSE